MSSHASRGARIALCALLLLAAGAARGQAGAKRLSEWLLEQPRSSGAYLLGLSWRVPEERPAQSLLQADLLESLEQDALADPAARRRLRDWLRALPVTGRVAIALADARWLEANPVRDPVLLPGHSVVLPPRPATVTVVTGQGERCAVVHAPGREAMAYVEACAGTAARQADWVWLAQPDGRVQRFGTASWNREAQDEAAPGAWLWAPARDSGFSGKLSERLVRFLATQGPAADPESGALDVAPPGASAFAARSRSGAVTTNDWGGAGLLQTPSARMARTGELAFSLSRVQPYTHANVFVQPLDWLEVGFRYTNISNRAYGPAALSGSQAYKDKSVDAKLRLWKESAYVPEVALGLRDLSGTGFYAGEYLVGSKRTGELDWSLGLGWGYVGARGNLPNPLSVFSKKLDTRKADVGEGGNVSGKNFFRGRTALFGGVQYQSPWERVILKLEYDGNNYQHEPQSNNQRQSSPFNFGLVYRASRWTDLSLGVERGNTIMLGLTLYTGLDEIGMPKLNDPPRVPATALRPAREPDWAATSGEIARQTGWQVRRIERAGADVRVTVNDAEAGYWGERVDRAAAVLNRNAPADVERFTLAYRSRGLAVGEHVIDREAWVAESTQPLPPHERRETVIAQRAHAAQGAELYSRERPRFEAGLGFDWQQTLGGPDAFLLYQLSAVERMKLWLSDDTWLRGSFRLGLIDNYQRFKYTAPSDLPRVRTFLREYVTTSRFTMPLLQATHAGKLSENQYYSVYGGYLEEMFGGVGAEWLYRPFAGRNAVGVDINAVKQRAFEQDFGFRDYRVATGHATLYLDTGWQDVLAKVSAGRYLAGDRGVTLELTRVFRNGVTVGAYATKTNVSAARFGEGSFDKGIYLSIPFDALLTRSNPTTGYFLWKPLTRDGGAKLARAEPLYEITSVRSDRTLWYRPAPKSDETLIPADQRGRGPLAPRAAPEPYTRLSPRPSAAQWTADRAFAQRLVQALYEQEFRNIEVAYDFSHRLSITLSNDRIRPVSRAAGRAARTALRLAPLEVRELRVLFVEGGSPVSRYEFIDVERLERYLNGAGGEEDLAGYVAVLYADASARPPQPLARLNDLRTDDEPKGLADVLADAADAVPVKRAAGDASAAAASAAGRDWLEAGAVGAGIVLASSALDNRAFRFAEDHRRSRWLKGASSVGNAIPWLAMGGAGLAALDGSDPVRQRTGFAAAEAGATAFAAATGLKYAVGRARPRTGEGNHSFESPSRNDRFNSFPSRHAAVAWAVATPFAEEYNSPWPYVAASLTSIGRVASGEHWLSDSVAGSLLGYGIGRIFWESARARHKDAPRFMLSPRGAALEWEFQ